jgi:hypothetical protein
MQWLASKVNGYQSMEQVFKNGDKFCATYRCECVFSEKKMAL